MEKRKESIMSFKKKNIERPTGNIKKWSDYDGTWQEYLGYLNEKGKLSHNFIEVNGKFILRD